MSVRKKRQTPEVGTIIRRTHKGQEYTMEVVKREGGVRFLVSGKEYKTPSGAAKAVCQCETNGWVFWRLD